MKREKKTLLPTELGFHVIGLLEEYFKDIVDAGFTASMEDKLDGVEAEGAEWKNIIREFYDPFRKDLEKADAAIEKVRISTSVWAKLLMHYVATRNLKRDCRERSLIEDRKSVV